MTRRCIAVLSGLAFAIAPLAKARWSTQVNTEARSGVSFRISSPVASSPTQGTLPFWISIQNGSGAAHTWDVRLTSSSINGSDANRSSVSQTIRVENAETVRVPILLPPPPNEVSYYRRCTAFVDGYGIIDRSLNLPISDAGRTGGAPTGYIAMGETLAVPLWESLRKGLKDAGKDLDGSPVEVSQLGSDWRGYAGFDCLWLTEAEYAGLDPGVKTGIRRWVEQGGALYLCSQGFDPGLQAWLGVKDGQGTSPSGLGSITLIPWDGRTFKLEDAMQLVEKISPVRSGLGSADAIGWGMTHSVGPIPINTPFLIVFICLFAAIAGPVNLFWLASATRRHRIFWTTPLISISASLLLILFIMIQDGFGAHGERLMVTRLFPEQKEAVVQQEQVTRSGVLLSHEFTVPEDVTLSMVKTRRLEGQNLKQAGRTYGGDWFSSRSVQAHRLEAVIPSRAQIQLVNAGAVQGGAAPVIVSSIAATLAELQYLDAENRLWRGANVRTGERVTLQRGKDIDRSVASRGSIHIRDLVGASTNAPGFFAIAADAPFLPTLPSVRWTRQNAVYLGPVSLP